MAVVDRGQLLHLLGGGELAAVVAGYGAEDLAEVLAQIMPECMQHPQYLAGSFAFQYADNLVAGLALGQHQQAAARPGALADYRVHLPEADILAGLHLGRAFLYATVVLVVFGGVLLVLLFLQLVAADRQVQAAQAEVSPVDVSVGRVGGNLRQCHTLQQDLPHRSGGAVMALAYVVLKMGGQLRAELDRAALVQVAHLIGPVLRFLGGVDHIGFRSSVVQLLTQAALLFAVDGALAAPNHRRNLHCTDLGLEHCLDPDPVVPCEMLSTHSKNQPFSHLRVFDLSFLPFPAFFLCRTDQLCLPGV